MQPIQVGLIGTGYAAKARAESLKADDRSQLVAVAGHLLDQTVAFSQTYGTIAVESWMALIDRPELDLIIIANVNGEHGKIARAALEAGKHVVVEYPLSIDYPEAVALNDLARIQQKLLHVEHIELLSGIHQAIKAAISEIGAPFYARYTSFNAQQPAPRKWTYSSELFGFPLIGAVSRIHRLTNLFGQVLSVSCQARFQSVEEPLSLAVDRSSFYSACLCTAQLKFASGLIAELTYGKGDCLWQSVRALDIHGEQGGIFVNGDQGRLVKGAEVRSLDLGTRRGLFAKDTALVLDHLTTQAPLYVSLADSLYALKVAEAARQSAEMGQPIDL